MAVPTPPLPPLLASYRSQPPPPGYRSALLSKRSITPSFSASVVVRTAEVNGAFASFADTTADAGVANAYSSSAAAAKKSEPLSAAAATAMEMNEINAKSNDEEEAVILRRDFVNAWGGGGVGEGDYEDNGD